MCAQRRFRSDGAFAQSDQNLHWSHLFLRITKDAEFLHVENEYSAQTPRDAQADLSLRWVHMWEDRFLMFGPIFLLISFRELMKNDVPFMSRLNSQATNFVYFEHTQSQLILWSVHIAKWVTLLILSTWTGSLWKRYTLSSDAAEDLYCLPEIHKENMR